MPPEFKPSERSKKKQEPLKPKEPRTVDDIVDDIMKDYRDKQRELGNVDNWGQPNEKLDRMKVKAWVHKNLPKLNDNAKEVKDRGKTKFSPNAPIESASEAIGNKLKEKADTQADKQKKAPTPKISEPRKSMSNPRERSSPRAKSPSKNERKERPVPKIKVKPSEVKKKKIRSPTVSTEGLSRAIGGKLKEKAEQLKDRTKVPTTSEPRTPTHSPKEKKSPQLKKPSNKESKERLGPKLKMKPPEVRGEKITSKERLRELANTEYSALKKKKDFPQRMKEAEVHQDLMKKYAGKERIEHGEIGKIAKVLDVDRETVSNWLTKGMNPRLYTYMNWSTPKSEAAEKVRKIQESNNGIRNSQDVQKRLDNYYLGPEERVAKFHPRELKKMDKYFEFLDVYKNGGLHLENAKEVGLSDAGAKAYVEGATPRLVELARQIPSEVPQDGYKWLPQKYEHGGHGGKWSDWIQVPEKVTDYQQVMDVVKQLKPLDNADMRRWEKKYGGISTELNFMYLLGVTVSDSSVPSSSTGAISMGMNLSKKYEWSKDFGDATCYYLGQIGIRAGRVKDTPAAVAQIETKSGIRRIHSEEQYKWMSENRSLLRWVRRSCLGYNDSAKTYQSTNVNWILRSPHNYRHAFLQGIADGDGYVSNRGYRFGISTHSDHDLVERLFSSFDIGAYRSRTYVRTNGFHSVKKAAEVQPFRHAESRKSSLEEIVRMIDAKKQNIKMNPPSLNEIQFMKNELVEGKSLEAINESIFRKYGYTLDTRTIRRLTKTKEREG